MNFPLNFIIARPSSDFVIALYLHKSFNNQHLLDPYTKYIKYKFQNTTYIILFMNLTKTKNPNKIRYHLTLFSIVHICNLVEMKPFKDQLGP